ncbi:unnamed protein product [Medioppia subpectinata]|uniref:Protein CDV3 homolog n=1 Tax=Medioppia subpectinata TaxID=1979941 RepID=A0A7R9LAD4_9ACAR|nr:unnamed protein product [Medioppia subpectinata]CAG2117248.1 unnamed protein product [Medioppia subpectinata]
MADTEGKDKGNLDDFFAKKDQKKNKNKKKSVLTSNEELAKKLEETGKRGARRVKDKTNMSALSNNGSDQESEEWNEAPDEKEKDYSGLRIQTLNIKDKEEEFREQQLLDIEEEKQNNVVSGPWKGKVSGGDGDSESEKGANDEDKPVVPPPTPAAPAAPSGKYVPPGARNLPQTTTGGGLAPMRRGPKSGAPKIQDIVEFPSLGAMDSSEDKGFQTVRTGNTRPELGDKRANVTLDNKYGLLTNTSKELQNTD